MKITGLRSFMSRDGNRPRVLVAIDTDEGITGWGECYNHGPDRALPLLLEYLFLQLQGEDPRRVEAIILKLMQQARFPPGALGLAAISAVCTARRIVETDFHAKRQARETVRLIEEPAGGRDRPV